LAVDGDDVGSGGIADVADELRARRPHLLAAEEMAPLTAYEEEGRQLA